MKKNKILAKGALCLSILAMLLTLCVFGVSAESLGEEIRDDVSEGIGDVSEGLDDVTDLLPGTGEEDTDGITDPGDDGKTDGTEDTEIVGADSDSAMENSDPAEKSRAVWIIVTVIAVVIIVIVVIALVTKK